MGDTSTDPIEPDVSALSVVKYDIRYHYERRTIIRNIRNRSTAISLLLNTGGGIPTVFAID